jgi:hypothetical protein
LIDSKTSAKIQLRKISLIFFSSVDVIEKGRMEKGRNDTTGAIIPQ